MTHALPLVSFIVPVRDDAARLKRCLASLRASAYPADRLEIVVADNGSRDDSAGVARAAGADVISAPDRGVAALRNRAAAHARGQILAFVDADHEIAAGWVPSAVEVLADPHVAATGTTAHPPLDGTWVQRRYDALRDHRIVAYETEWLGAGNMAIKREAFDRVGGFDESLDSCEDVALSQRLRACGYRLVDDGRLRSTHLGDPPTLRALFFGELWRGRDNLRVSLQRVTLGGLPSAVIPVVDLTAMVAALAGILAAPLGGIRVSLAATAVVMGLASLRAAQMLSRIAAPTLRAMWEVWIVAMVYDLARALALVARAGHRVRREAEGA
jgi:hypothetical protein